MAITRKAIQIRIEKWYGSPCRYSPGHVTRILEDRLADVVVHGTLKPEDFAYAILDDIAQDTGIILK